MAGKHGGWNPQSAREWALLGRDVAMVMLAAFLIVYGALTVTQVDRLALIFGFGGTLLGLPAAFRLDQKLRGNGGGK